MKKNVAISLLLCLVLTSCEQFYSGHLIKSKAQRNEVMAKFAQRLNLITAADSSISTILAQKLPQKEREGLQFLYAYMPLCDLTMQSPSYIHQQVKTALEANKTFKWGNKVPKEIFLHFVLPYRANNEYPDNARQVFFNELKDRVIGLNMYNAALEVNHWCHEKANYRPSDSRTSGPLTVVRTTHGRCGEESTFTVTALRAVGIPARQVYTPRWAHTDDNHAWVEVWVDGKWYFLGACEPDPELNMGWFAAPSKRTMMTRTFVFGKYYGKEEKLSESEYNAELNLLGNYADTKRLTIKVIDNNGTIVPDAKVEYQLYNYSEFYPIARRTTNSKGTCTITTGFGDLMIWANHNNLYGLKKADRMLDTLTVAIAEQALLTAENFTIIPPDAKPIPTADEQKIAANNRRLQQEDMIRAQYEATFFDSATAIALATKKGLNANETWHALKLSRGNWPEIKDFIENLEEKDLTVGMAILNNIAEKDLHDITADILRSHISSVDLYPSLVDAKQFSVFDKYVLSPRIGLEYITSWRNYIQDHFTYEEIGFFRNNPNSIANWIRQNINIDNDGNYYNVPISPEGVLKYGTSDKQSRDILFVAICRSFGIPARLEPATKKPQFLMRGLWNDILFEPLAEIQPRGQVTISVNPKSAIQNPQYYTHYTIAKLQNGRFETLDYENSPAVAKLPAKLEVETGKYRMVTGNRQNDGSVLCKVTYFDVTEGENTPIEIDFAQGETLSAKILGKMDINTAIPNMKGEYTSTIFSNEQDQTSTTSAIAIIDPGTEPTKHLLNDLATVSSELARTTNRILLIIASNKLPETFKPSDIKGLPRNTAFGFDKENLLAQAIARACNTDIQKNYPVVIATDKEGNIIYHSSGYSIGMGEQILKTIR